jgi:cytochrome c oxidase subunit III
MATTIHEPPQIDPKRMPDHGHTRNGGWKSIVPADGDLHVATEYSPPPSSTAIWVFLFAVTMMFAAFSSALIVRKGSSLDWQGFSLPSILYFNTLLLLVSSVTLEVARRRVATFMGGLRNRAESPTRWLYVTLVLGLLFVVGQYVAWRQLSAQGLYLATNPSSSFFYLLTAVHGIHVLGGLGGLLYVIGKLNKSILRRNTLVATARYWHFMGVLWVYLIVLLWIKL